MSDAITAITTVATSVMTFIEGQPVLMVFMCSGILGIGISVVKRLVGRY